jgi:hypothetical protein
MISGSSEINTTKLGELNIKFSFNIVENMV